LLGNVKARGEQLRGLLRERYADHPFICTAQQIDTIVARLADAIDAALAPIAV